MHPSDTEPRSSTTAPAQREAWRCTGSHVPPHQFRIVPQMSWDIALTYGAFVLKNGVPGRESTRGASRPSAGATSSLSPGDGLHHRRFIGHVDKCLLPGVQGGAEGDICRAEGDPLECARQIKTLRNHTHR